MPDLYDRDFYAWTQQQARALKARDAAALDWPNLLEEIESLGRSERRAVESALHIALIHLLKFAYSQGSHDPERGWRISARQGRRQVARELRRQPSLRPLLTDLLRTAYDDAKQDAHDELADFGDTHAPFPDACPWSVQQVLDEGFWPEATS
jgi:hypothetical protein